MWIFMFVRPVHSLRSLEETILFPNPQVATLILIVILKEDNLKDGTIPIMITRWMNLRAQRDIMKIIQS